MNRIVREFFTRAGKPMPHLHISQARLGRGEEAAVAAHRARSAPSTERTARADGNGTLRGGVLSAAAPIRTDP